MQSKQLVVAKYKEDISWVADIKMPVVVYDKCPSERPDIEFPDNVQFVEIDNVRNGREAHSYLSHMLVNYDSLADVTFFVQGNPFEHSPHLLKRLELDYHDAESLTLQYTDFHPTYAVREKDKVVWRDGIETRYGNAYYYTDNRHYHNKRWLEMVWSKVFPAMSLPKQMWFGYGAQWAVPRRRIVQRLPLFYHYCLKEMMTEPSVMTAWAFEVLWYYIFQDYRKYKDIFTYINYYSHVPAAAKEFPCMY